MIRRTVLFTAAIAALTGGTAVAAVNVQTNSDGTQYTSILVNGSSNDKYDIVFVGDGFTESEQDIFNARVNDAVAALQARAPYSTRMCAFNIWRVNVVSSESGVDHPMQSISKNTELDTRYGNTANGEAERCITSDSPGKCFEAANYAPAHDAVFVLVNDTQWGGCAGSLVFSAIAPGFAGIVTHELGHKISGLADEYTCYKCDGTDSNTPYVGPEPSQVNVTKEKTHATIKWNDLIAGTTPLPTTVDSPAGVVGAWEGGMYAAREIYRPQNNCHMRNTGSEFCAVCGRKMDNDLTSRCKCELFPWACIPIRRFVACKAPCIRWWWKIDPGCYQCPDIRIFDERILVFDGLTQDARLTVVDEMERVMAEGQATRDGKVELKFKAERSKTYYVRLDSKELKANVAGDLVRLSVTSMRNGKEEALEAAEALGAMK